MKKLQPQIEWDLFRKAIDERLSEEENERFSNWLGASDQNKAYFDKAKLYYGSEAYLDNRSGHDHKGAFEEFRKKVTRKKERIIWLTSAAAVIIVLISISIRLFVEPVNEGETIYSVSEAKPINVSPNKNIELLLSDGSTIEISSDGRKVIKEKAGESIIKNEGALNYYNTNLKSKGDEKLRLNTVQVPRGSEFKIVLSDSTIVWLNAESSLTYPLNFINKTREVEVTGEAYFEVAHNMKKPFIVKANGTNIEVLGTVFNIDAYNPDDAIITTLVSGSVEVNNNNGKLVLRPNEQAVCSPNRTVVSTVDLTEAIDWRNGNFYFEDERLEDILKDLSRWYELDVNFSSDDLKNVRFGGVLKRYDDINKLLILFEKTEAVKFYLSDKNELFVNPVGTNR